MLRGAPCRGSFAVSRVGSARRIVTEASGRSRPPSAFPVRCSGSASPRAGFGFDASSAAGRARPARLSERVLGRRAPCGRRRRHALFSDDASARRSVVARRLRRGFPTRSPRRRIARGAVHRRKAGLAVGSSASQWALGTALRASAASVARDWAVGVAAGVCGVSDAPNEVSGSPFLSTAR